MRGCEMGAVVMENLPEDADLSETAWNTSVNVRSAHTQQKYLNNKMKVSMPLMSVCIVSSWPKLRVCLYLLSNDRNPFNDLMLTVFGCAHYLALFLADAV